MTTAPSLPAAMPSTGCVGKKHCTVTPSTLCAIVVHKLKHCDYPAVSRAAGRVPGRPDTRPGATGGTHQPVRRENQRRRDAVFPGWAESITRMTPPA